MVTVGLSICRCRGLLPEFDIPGRFSPVSLWQVVRVGLLCDRLNARATMTHFLCFWLLWLLGEGGLCGVFLVNKPHN